MTAIPTPAGSSIPGSPDPGSIFDVLPYPHRAFAQTHPDVLATVATVFGMTPPAVETARVLELGCASGGNLIPIAEMLPRARLVGIDASGRQIDAGRAVVRSLGLQNIDLRREELAGFADEGPFDYIICHGVFSWVPAAARARILELCATRLAPNGVAYVSYNVYPGWHLHGMLRAAMQWHTRRVQHPVEKARRAKELLDFLSATAPLEGGPAGTALGHTFGGGYGMMLKGLADQLRALSESNLYHDYLAEQNEPVHFHEFIEQATASGLQYLGEAAPEMMTTAGLGEQVEQALRRVAGDWIEAEQYLDYVRNRAFRQTLLVRADAKLHRQIDAQWVRSLYAGSPVEPVPESEAPAPGLLSAGGARTAPPGEPETFKHPRGSTVAVANPMLRAAMKALADAWPGRLSFAQLTSATWQRMGLGPADPTGAGGTAAAEKKLCALLLQGYFTGMVELSARPATWATDLSDRPAARRLARLQAETDDTVTTLRHQNLKLNRTARHVLRLLDGTRTRADLLRDIERGIVEGARAIGGAVEFSAAQRAELAKNLEKDLRRFVAEGLMLK
jgi:methyltransferase-like protein/2-polyprenyl-3-methyl-5-hydroxy-6-metoxy-1,4-benzoquinol methylase